MKSSNEDTIVALATPTGVGALAIIRVSGNLSKTILDKLFRPINNQSIKPRELQLGWIQEGSKKLDQAMAVYMPNPNSFTGEDVVEFHLHGSPAIIQSLISSIITHPGIRQAEAGEFTRRAFMNGKIDLVQAEAVAELISAQNERSAKQASSLLNGELSNQIEKLKSKVISLSAFYIANIDFSEEDIPAISPTKALQTITEIKQTIEQLIQNAKHQNVIREGFKVALVGLPNAGKSTLLNNLLGYDRALVSDIAGTTRDILSESITINGVHYILTDTAGLHTTKDTVERLGIERTKAEIEQSDIVLLLIEPGEQADTQKYLEDNNLLYSLKQSKVLVVFTKSDITTEPISKFFSGFTSITISSEDRQLVTNLTKSLEKLTSDINLESVQLLTNRQLSLFNEAVKQLELLEKLLIDQESDDIILVELQAVVDIFNSLSGKQTSGEMINEVFANFCIGK
ncbi:MAG: tRNA uridine-5-carboxymethylaminomethyl(34) synthesis GTPase MnmE [Candidatus Saccharibacteria bacterium]